ncbi:transposase [Bdellovibrio sp. HCB185ZH]|uniref:transposase n=1 Tax=Bdellovibrio sp. HCB185ZH TaxID=3394235 RepID=UPI0039A51052
MQRSHFDDPRLQMTQAHGGTLFKKARHRCRRPLSTKKPLHLVLRSSQAKGSLSFRKSKNWKQVESLCRQFARKYKIKIESFANGGSHLHLTIRLNSKDSYSPFIRSLTGAIALKLTGANRTQKNAQKFWDFRPFTAVLEKAKHTLKNYVSLEFLKDLQVIPRIGILTHQEWPP